MDAALPPDKLLALYPALGSLAQAEMAALCKADAVVNLAEGTELYAERQACRGFPLLISGTIKVVKTTPAGREMLLYRALFTPNRCNQHRARFCSFFAFHM